MTEHTDIKTGLAQIHAETRWLRRKNAQAFSGSVIAAAFAAALLITINTRSLIWGIAAFGFATVIASVVFAFQPRAGAALFFTGSERRCSLPSCFRQRC